MSWMTWLSSTTSTRLALRMADGGGKACATAARASFPRVEWSRPPLVTACRPVGDALARCGTIWRARRAGSPPRRPQSAAARRRPRGRRTAARAGRRRQRQDAGDRAPYRASARRARRPSAQRARRDLHEQGRRRDGPPRGRPAGAGRHQGAADRDVSLRVRADSQSPRRGHRAAAPLHDLRRGRPRRARQGVHEGGRAGDQSIYKFRGADVNNILDFEHDYPGTRVVKLEQNYRSTQRVLAVASAVIANNQARKERTLWTENPQGEPAAVYRGWDEHEEANFVAPTILKTRADGVGWDGIAVFYRTNAQSRVLEDALRRARIPYVIVGGVRFYERKEIKDTLAWLRLTINPADDVAFRRAVQAPTRGVGATTLARLDELALDAQEPKPLLTLAAAPPPDVRGKARAGLEDFAVTVGRLASQRGELSPPAFIDLVLQASGYRKALEQDRSPEAEGRLENLEELIAAAEDFAHAEGEATVEAFLDSVALMSDVDELKEAEARVTLMTLHSAKGLEFPVVFLSGLEEGVFPH